MRKRLIIRKDEQAVSPVIATILMVAITVVLAAVLYVMVTGLLGGGSQQTPFVTFGSPENISSGTWTVAVAEVTGISGAHTLDSWEVQVLNGTTTAIAAVSLATAENPGASGGGLTLDLTDVGGSSGGGRISAGDIFTLGGAGAGNVYKVLLIWKQSGGSREFTITA